MVLFLTIIKYNNDSNINLATIITIAITRATMQTTAIPGIRQCTLTWRTFRAPCALWRKDTTLVSLPSELPILLLNLHIINAGIAVSHYTLRIEGPVL